MTGEAVTPTWPGELDALFERAEVVEYTSLTASGQPISVPATPYVGEERRTLDVSTGLSYPAKAERARRNPRVCLLFSGVEEPGAGGAPVALVQGLAAVRDADLQANTDRYVRLTLAKTPAPYAGMPRWAFRLFGWYFARIWVQVGPVRVLWWPDGDLERAPRRWEAGEGFQPAVSDPPPAGRAPGPWLPAPRDWRPVAAYALRRLPRRDLSWVGDDGLPVCVPVRTARLAPDGFDVELPSGVPQPSAGPGCLSFHVHSVPFAWQENRAFVGEIEPKEPGQWTFHVKRALADWSVHRNALVRPLAFLSTAVRLYPRLRREAARRGQPLPRVNPPPTR